MGARRAGMRPRVRMAVAVRHASVLADGVRLERAARLCHDAVYVHRAVRTLRRDVFIEWVPRNALHVVQMLCDLVYAFSCTHTFISD